MENTEAKDKLKVAVALLEASLPYITSHYEKSRATFGVGALKLINAIKEFIVGSK